MFYFENMNGWILFLLMIIIFHTAVDTVDKLDEFFGLVPADINKKSSSDAYSPISTLDSDVGDWNPQSMVTLYVDESPDVVIVTCEVTLPSKRHSLHLLCPLVSSTRLCFENCRRVCTSEDCSDNINLFTVDCVEDVFVRDMYNIWKFRYIINRHNPAIEMGAWGCFHAGKSTETVQLSAATTKTSTMLFFTKTTSKPILRRIFEPQKSIFFPYEKEWDRVRNASSFILTKPSNITEYFLFNQSSMAFLPTMVLVLIGFLVFSITINIVYVIVFVCRRKREIYRTTNSTTSHSLPTSGSEQKASKIAFVSSLEKPSQPLHLKPSLHAHNRRNLWCHIRGCLYSNRHPNVSYSMNPSTGFPKCSSKTQSTSREPVEASQGRPQQPMVNGENGAGLLPVRMMQSRPIENTSRLVPIPPGKLISSNSLYWIYPKQIPNQHHCNGRAFNQPNHYELTDSHKLQYSSYSRTSHSNAFRQKPQFPPTFVPFQNLEDKSFQTSHKTLQPPLHYTRLGNGQIVSGERYYSTLDSRGPARIVNRDVSLEENRLLFYTNTQPKMTTKGIATTDTTNGASGNKAVERILYTNEQAVTPPARNTLTSEMGSFNDESLSCSDGHPDFV